MDNRSSKVTPPSVIKRKQTLRSVCVGFAFFILLFFLTEIFDSSLCLINRIFGVKCFGCGMTRGFISILKLDFLSAYKYNILSIPLFFALFIYSLLAVIDFIFKKDLIEFIEKILIKKIMFAVYLVILIFVLLKMY